MRTIIAGSRDLNAYGLVCAAVEASGFVVTSVLSGGARGIDKMGERWAGRRGIPVAVYPADWKLHGNRAGPIRNAKMADNADALVAVWDGESRGTKHMIETALRRGLKVYVHDISDRPRATPTPARTLTTQADHEETSPDE